MSCNNGGFPRYVLNQLKIFVPVGKDIAKIETKEKELGTNEISDLKERIRKKKAKIKQIISLRISTNL